MPRVLVLTAAVGVCSWGQQPLARWLELYKRIALTTTCIRSNLHDTTTQRICIELAVGAACSCL
jgi:hypothetical protein